MPSFTHEVEFGIAAPALWAVLKEQNTLFPKLMPEVYASIEMIEGSGEPGSIRIINFGPMVKLGPGARGPDFVKEKLISLDLHKYSVVAEEVEGGHKKQFGFSKWVQSVKVVPVSDSTSKLEFSAEFEGGSESEWTAASAETKEGLNNSLKAIEEYVKSSSQ